MRIYKSAHRTDLHIESIYQQTQAYPLLIFYLAFNDS